MDNINYLQFSITDSLETYSKEVEKQFPYSGPYGYFPGSDNITINYDIQISTDVPRFTAIKAVDVVFLDNLLQEK